MIYIQNFKQGTPKITLWGMGHSFYKSTETKEWAAEQLLFGSVRSHGRRAQMCIRHAGSWSHQVWKAGWISKSIELGDLWTGGWEEWQTRNPVSSLFKFRET